MEMGTRDVKSNKKQTRYRVINWRIIMPINDRISRFYRYFVLTVSKNVQNIYTVFDNIDM